MDGEGCRAVVSALQPLPPTLSNRGRLPVSHATPPAPSHRWPIRWRRPPPRGGFRPPLCPPGGVGSRAESTSSPPPGGGVRAGVGLLWRDAAQRSPPLPSAWGRQVSFAGRPPLPPAPGPGPFLPGQKELSWEENGEGGRPGRARGHPAGGTGLGRSPQCLATRRFHNGAGVLTSSCSGGSWEAWWRDSQWEMRLDGVQDKKWPPKEPGCKGLEDSGTHGPERRCPL